MSSFVQAGVVQAGSGGDLTCTPGASNVQLGDTIFVCVGWDHNDNPGNPPSLTTDNLGNVFSLVYQLDPVPSTTVTSQQIWAAPVTFAGASSTLVSMKGQRGGAVALEYAGITSQTVDQTVSG